ncbi:MAG: hypothetical protein ACTHO8_00505 [Solirubrobacterales bacterium]
MGNEVSATPLEEACERLGELLELEGPVSEEVAAAAATDQIYARNLLSTRDAPALLEHLLANPPEVREEPSTLALGGRLAQAMVRWGRTGFTVVDEETRQQRLAACAACPHQMEANRHPTLHRWLADGERPMVCGLCGCALARKTRLGSERCPDEDPDRPGFDRWGLPYEP